MSIEFNLPPFFQPLADNASIVKVNGRTIGECLEELVQQHPRLKPKIFTRKGKLIKGLSIFINGQATNHGAMARPVRDGDKLHITYIVMGG
jgi:molybdopterin converting factor small subunit